MWSVAVASVLTTLRYLAPFAPTSLITLFWGQQSLLFRFLRFIDSAVRSIIYSSNEQRESVLKWLGEAGPVKVEHLDTVWRHGWVLCGVLDVALPGACAGHPTTRLSLEHAQNIADQYLGVEPVFTNQELQSNDSLTKKQEWKLAHYLNRIRQALAKLSPPVSKPCSPCSLETPSVTLDYTVQGSGLTSAQIHENASFQIFPTAQQSLEPGEITVFIRGPKDIYGMTVIPSFLGKTQLLRQKLLGIETKTHYTESILPIPHGATYLRAYGKNDMNKTYYIPKSKYDIEIETKTMNDHIKVLYKVPLEGQYEVSVTSRGLNIQGSPFAMRASKNIIEYLERDSFIMENSESPEMDDGINRKVVLRIVDFVTEKMLLKENGVFEKISDEEASTLLSLNKKEIISKKMKFVECVEKVVAILEVIKAFKTKIDNDKHLLHPSKEICSVQEHNQFLDVPDIVNSTLNENSVEVPKQNHEIDLNESDKLIENRTTCLNNNTTNELTVTSIPEEFNLNNKNVEKCQENERYIISSNPFKEEHNNNFIGINEIPITITCDSTSSCSTPSTNPFIEPEILYMERPKTPILKIISEQEQGVFNPLHFGYDYKNCEDHKSNEFINPFFVHKFRDSTEEIEVSEATNDNPVADFKIGALVSLPPVIKPPSPEPDMDSVILASNLDEALYKYEMKLQTKKDSHSNNIESTSFSKLVKNISNDDQYKLEHETSILDDSSFHSIEFNPETTNYIFNSTTNDRKPATEFCKKDIWDSAYVSIDDSSASPDNNDLNTLNDLPMKKKGTANDLNQDSFLVMGPAERELWQTCEDLSANTIKHEETTNIKYDTRRPLFTPIIEESERSISSSLKDPNGPDQIPQFDPIGMAFAGLNDVFNEYCSNSENSSLDILPETNDSKEVEYTVENVDSASADISDVMRLVKHNEGLISEVQLNKPEFSSVSRTLQDLQTSSMNTSFKDKTHFGEDNRTNIVLEKKLYWDERIRILEEIKSQQQQKKKKISKSFKQNDSLTRRKGKSLMKNMREQFSKENNTEKNSIDSNDKNIQRQYSVEVNECSQGNEYENTSGIKLVEKWRKYWDEVLEHEKEISNSKDHTIAFSSSVTNVKTNPFVKDNSIINKDKFSEVSKETSQTTEKKYMTETTPLHITNKAKLNEVGKEATLLTEKDYTTSITPLHRLSDQTNAKSITQSFEHVDTTSQSPMKQEIGEELFKAFETSPKRFFGTSRKQIINKIDSCLGNSNDDLCKTGSSLFRNAENGLVSSRINLFHNITNTEELPRKKHIWDYNKSNTILSSNVNKWNANDITITPSISTSLKDVGNSITRTKLESKVFTSTSDLLKPKETSGPISVNKQNIQPLISDTYKFDSKEKRNERLQKSKLGSISFDNSYKQTRPKLSASKSETDIYTHINTQQIIEDDDKYKSLNELSTPKPSVKKFITMYENVTKSAAKEAAIITKHSSQRKLSHDQDKQTPKYNANAGIQTKDLSVAPTSPIAQNSVTPTSDEDRPTPPPRKKYSRDSPQRIITPPPRKGKLMKTGHTESKHFDDTRWPQDAYNSDVEVEIIEKSSDMSDKGYESTPEMVETVESKDYKSRFALAREYFKSLEEIVVDPKARPEKLNECELLLYSKTDESPKVEIVEKPKRKKKVKSHSLPSPEFEKVWNEIQGQETENKLTKISEKFNVDDLFNDVISEGRLSRQGSFKGIPHKKAVLATFRSMESVRVEMTSYEIAITQLSNFAKDNKIKNAQTYLTEYPYLPTTEPSKYHSRYDAKAAGLISRSEMLKKERRSSVPDLTLNPKFIADL